jgi:hypothetical protein
MFAHLWPHVPASLARGATRCIHPAPFAALALTGLLAGCAGAPSAPVSGAHSADAAAPARPAAYRSVIGPYASQRPREPSAWTDTNTRVAPQDKP